SVHGRIPGSRNSSMTSRPIPARRRRCISGSTFECRRKHGDRMSTPANQLLGNTSRAHRLLSIVGMVGYRFFLYSGLLPYGLGGAWAYWVYGKLHGPVFWWGCFGGV